MSLAHPVDGQPLPPWSDPRAEQLRRAPRLARWWYALKPASWPKLLVPALLGQGAGALHAGRVDVAAALLGSVFSLGLLVFIVLLNDWSDAGVDRVKRALYPSECSPKTIPDQLLEAGALLRAGLLALALAVFAAFAAEQLLARAWAGWAALACAGIFGAYSLPPLRLNYRGGGELLEALGVGVALPVWNAYVQGGAALPPVLSDLLPAFATLSLGSALASGLSDEVSDRCGGKRTFTTWLGNPRVCRAVLACTLVAAALFVLAPLARLRGGSMGLLEAPAAGIRAVGAASPPALGPPDLGALVAGAVGACFCVVAFVRMRRVSPAPRTDVFASQALFKQRLHGAIWYGSVAVLVMRALLMGRG
ncbi:MAG: prenyltransferase [Sandaracinaceae bacterium]|nr:prenyltransferase [Sandaracinaceae bacterium]